MRKLFFTLVVVLLTTGCSFAAPTAPTSVTPPVAAGTPTTLELGVLSGVGDQGGTATISVHVLDAVGAPVANLAVGLTSTAGTLTPGQLTTDGAGRGTARLEAAPQGFVTVTASIANGPTRAAIVAIPPPPPPPPPPTPMPIPSPTPELPPPPLTVTLFVTPGQATVATSFSLATQAIASATWTFGDGGSVTTTQPFTTHVYNLAGTYEATVTVVDTRGRTASASQIFVIKPAPGA